VSPRRSATAAEVRATAPLRVDLAGGTLDLWPLGLLQPGGATAAVAISLRVAARAAPPPKPGVLALAAEDLAFSEEHPADAPLRRRGRLELLQRIAAALAPPDGVTLATRSPVAQGSGLGTSSALGVAAAAALLRYRGLRPVRDEVVALVRDLEAQVLGIPTGTQDHEAAWGGGAFFIQHAPGGETLWILPRPLLAALEERLVIFDSGRARSSGPSNWDMFRRRIEGDAAAVRALAQVADAGARAAEGLAAHDWRALGRAMRKDLDARRRWSPLVLTPALERAFDAARHAGALGFKVCGAGGGGYAVALADPARRARVARAIEETGARLSDARPTARGLAVARWPEPPRVRGGWPLL
jgi:D-glycero-alpha-D-manno-heptose-7-phosphate kinase